MQVVSLWCDSDSVMVVLASNPCFLSLFKPAQLQLAFPIPADNFPNELAHDSGEDTGVELSRCCLPFSHSYGHKLKRNRSTPSVQVPDLPAQSKGTI